MADLVHGTDAAYSRGKCRCLDCRAAHARSSKANRERRKAGLTRKGRAPYVHGTLRTYTEQKCRCADCRAAKSAALARDRMKRRARAPSNQA